MANELTQGFKATTLRKVLMRIYIQLSHYLCIPLYKQVALFALTVILLLGSVFISSQHPDAYAANPGLGSTCSWYRIRMGDTLGSIAWNNRTTIRRLASANAIINQNLIFAGQALCVPHILSSTSNTGEHASSGMLPGGYVRWYAYTALQWSTRAQVSALLHQAAARYGVPAKLLLAISWQESGWNQHLIARDGGIGAMQMMPYTAMVLNQMTHSHFDPYRLQDNINLGAIYVRTLWINFHGDTTKVISAYNEGGWNVVHRGIFNWRYVSNVRALMTRLR